MSDPLPVFARVSSTGHVTYVYADGQTVTLHGTHPYRDHNPGNLRFPGRNGLARAKTAGAIGIDGGFAVFADDAAGERALRAMIDRRAQQGLTVASFMSIYAPAGENNLAGYLAAVTSALQAKGTDLLSSLSEAQRGILAETIAIQEGGRSRSAQNSPPVWGKEAPPRP